MNAKTLAGLLWRGAWAYGPNGANEMLNHVAEAEGHARDGREGATPADVKYVGDLLAELSALANADAEYQKFVGPDAD